MLQKILLSVLVCTAVHAQKTPDFLVNYNVKWVDSVFNSLSLEQKIGQLLMPRGNNSGQPYTPEKVKAWIRDYHIGGIVMFAGQPTVQAALVNEFQALSKTPLLIGMDLEWGMAMRLDSTVRFPYQMGLGAMQNSEMLVEEMGRQIALQCKRLGVHVNYAPVVDVNNNPNNPVINFRSFGENREQVAQYGTAYMRGLQSEHILATAKHFPGHGDTGVDSHYDLPVVPHPMKRLDSLELYPYKKLISEGLSGVMTAHLSIPALDNTKNLAATLSPKIVSDLLRKDLGFEGLTFTDAMDMKGVVKHFPNGTALVKAILAGNDILETFEEVPQAVEAIKKALKSGELPMKVLDERVRKILKAKSWVGLDAYSPTKIDQLVPELNPYASQVLNAKMAEEMITLLKNEKDLLPIKHLESKIAIVAVGTNTETAFQKMASNYTYVHHYTLPENASDELIQSVHNAVHEYDIILITVHAGSIRPREYGIQGSIPFSVKALLDPDKSILCLFGNAYGLAKLEHSGSVVLAYQDSEWTQKAAAQAIFGALPFKGKLPVSVNEEFTMGMGLHPTNLKRLAYSLPELANVDSRVLEHRVDSVVNLGLSEKAYPGAVLQIAKDGRVIYQKAYGYHTYEDAENASKSTIKRTKTYETGTKKDVMDNRNPFEPESEVKYVEEDPGMKYMPKGRVQVDHIYDFASITKISTSALAVMQEMSAGNFDLNASFGEYYEPFFGSNKSSLTFKDMLTHKSGLKAWIPFWMDCVDTLATVKKGLAMKPEVLAEFSYYPPERRTFFQRIFKKAPALVIDTLGSLRARPDIWPLVLNTETITWLPSIFSSVKTDDFSVEVADTLWMHKDYRSTIFNQIKESPVKPDQGYVYSDLHYYTYPELFEQKTGMKWEDYLKKTYRKIGANSLSYNPRNHFRLADIVPTEKDTLFRKTQIHGRVHDEGAAMLNGISGHAGLFGNANDLTKLMTVYLQRGYYGGEQLLDPEVVEECTKYQFEPYLNRRAIAFDKLHPDSTIANGPQACSSQSYGHSGYTGTFTWNDPNHGLTYVFLSNRVYPTRDNNKISSLNIRTEIGNQIIYTIERK